MENDRVIYSVKDHVASLVMNNPKTLNGFDPPMIEAIDKSLHMAEADPEVRVIVITGAGPAFCGGGDITAMAKGLKDGSVKLSAEGIADLARMAKYMKQLPKPIICGAHNAVAGAGVNFCLAADFTIATKGTRFIEAFVNIGLIPDCGGVYLLSKCVGANRAANYCMTGKVVDAEEAKAVGMIYDVVEPDQLAEKVGKLAKRLANGPAVSYANMKKLIYAANYSDFDQYIPEEGKAQEICAGTEDFREGVFAFLEKRKAVFQGK